MHRCAFAFTLLLAAVLCASPAAAQLFIDDFTVDQGPIVGLVPSPGNTVTTTGFEIFGGSRTYSSIDSVGGAFTVIGGTATIDPGTSHHSAFLTYDANNTGLDINITGFESIILDVDAISGNGLNASAAVFLTSPGGGASTNDFFPLHNGQNVFDLKDFFDASSIPADFSALSGISVQIEAPASTTVSLNALSLASQLGASLGNRVWHDTNGNGQQDSGESGINNATVTLLGDLDGGGEANDIVGITQTISNGSYVFDNLAAGDYALQYALPTGFDAASPQTQGPSATDSDVDPATFVTPTFTLSQDNNDLTRDAGFFQYASAGDFVWHDLDGDGIQDDGEPGIEGVSVELSVIVEVGSLSLFLPVQEIWTNEDGGFLFDELIPGEEYRITFKTPDGFERTLSNVGSSDLDSEGRRSPPFILTSGELRSDFDSGFIPEPSSLALLGLSGLLVARRRSNA